MAIKTRINKTRRNVLSKQLRRAILGDENGNVDVPNQTGKVYIRLAQEKDDNGNALYSQAVSVWHDPQANYVPYAGMGVMVGLDENGELCVMKADRKAILSGGINPRAFNANDPQRAFVNPRNLTPAICRPVGTAGNPSTLVTIHPLLSDHLGDYVQYSGTQTSASKVDLSSYIPSSGNHLLAIVWLDLGTLLPSVTASTAQTITTALDSTDVQECFIARPPDSVPLAGFRLIGGATNITTADLYEDYRMWLNAPDSIGYENPLLHNTRLQSGWVLPVHGDYYAVDADIYAYGTLLNVSDGVGDLVTSGDLTVALSSPPPIGNITPNTGNFTTLGANATPSATQQLTVQASSATVIPLTVRVALAQTANSIEIQNSLGVNLAYFTATGSLTLPSTGFIRPIVDGTTALRIAKADGTTLFNIDTTNGRMSFTNNTPSTPIFYGANGDFIGLGVYGRIARQFSSTATAIGYNVSFPAASVNPTAINTHSAGMLALLMGGTNQVFDFLAVRGSVTTGDALTARVLSISDYGLSVSSAVPVSGERFKVIATATTDILGIFKQVASHTGDSLRVLTSGDVVLARIDKDGGAVFNENGTSTGDVRIEGDTDANLLFTDASADSVGVKTNAPNSRLQVNGSLSLPIVSKSADYTATIDDYTIVFTASATLNLPTAVGIAGRCYVVKSASGVSVTIDPAGTETIDGNLTHTNTSLKAHIIQSDGANWWIISQY